MAADWPGNCSMACGRPGWRWTTTRRVTTSVHEYNDYFAAYSSAPDIYRYDNLLFGGRFMPASLTRRELSPRGIAAPPDPGIDDVQWADGWKIGISAWVPRRIHRWEPLQLSDGEPAIPEGRCYSDRHVEQASTDALNTAEHAAAFVLPGAPGATGCDRTADCVFAPRHVPPSRARFDTKSIVLVYLGPDSRVGFPRLMLSPPTPRSLLQRNFRGLSEPLPSAMGLTREHLTLTITRGSLRLGTSQGYSATDGGGLQIFGGPRRRASHRRLTLERQLTDLTPTGYYHWSVLGNRLFITKVSDPLCSTRAQLCRGHGRGSGSHELVVIGRHHIQSHG